ncbi:MAG: hypothetical protein LBO04_05615 [Spirochaetaceae bacterium]|jgi:hypothetical protein|nr:hypothetical protein [Spirochaetaceae bacterium]
MRNKFLFLPVCIFIAACVVLCAAGCDKTELFGSNTEEETKTGAKEGGGKQTPDSPATPGTSGTPVTVSTIWYVAEDGSDSNEGDSTGLPLATVNAALGKIRALYLGGKWPAGASAEIVVRGTITGTATTNNWAMVNVSGKGNYPPVILRSDPAKPGILDANRKAGAEGPVMYIAANKVTLEDDIVLTGGFSLWGGGVRIGTYGGEPGGEFVMAGGVIADNKSGAGGGVYLQSGEGATFTMTGGKIEKNGDAGTENGGGIFIDGGVKAVMTGGEIIGNNSALQGGGVYIAPDGEFTMSGGLIVANASAEGGGVSINKYGATFKNEGGTVSGNSPDEASVTK